MTGWGSTLARRSRILNLPFAWGVIPVKNRYTRWAHLLGIPPQTILRTTRARVQRSRQVYIHVGASWLSRQYPEAGALAHSLAELGWQTELIAAPGDRFVAGLSEAAIRKVSGPELVSTLSGASFAITNDSGPMHLSAALGCSTFVLSRISDLRQWLPPGARASQLTPEPKGYRPAPEYTSDAVVAGWATPTAIAGEFDQWAREILGRATT